MECIFNKNFDDTFISHLIPIDLGTLCGIHRWVDIFVVKGHAQHIQILKNDGQVYIQKLWVWFDSIVNSTSAKQAFHNSKKNIYDDWWVLSQ